MHIPGIPQDWEADVARDLELIGGPRTMVHYPCGWGMASNTPAQIIADRRVPDLPASRSF
ncbi:hypothetical protein AAII07_01970 [Microvirga sp. 0TCS3.31]